MLPGQLAILHRPLELTAFTRWELAANCLQAPYSFPTRIDTPRQIDLFCRGQQVDGADFAQVLANRIAALRPLLSQSLSLSTGFQRFYILFVPICFRLELNPLKHLASIYLLIMSIRFANVMQHLC
jgi:hypothetical protein